MIPRRIITTWICDAARDRYQPRHREMLAHCLTSWLRLMPDYEVVVVTLGNLFAHGEDQWCADRVREGNFIGCSQWARLRFLQARGGVFLDSDVEAVQRFDSLLSGGCTVGHLGNGQRLANNCVMAAPAGHPFLSEQLAHIRGCDPRHPDFGNNTGPFMMTQLLARRGWDGEDRDAQAGEVTVRRSAVFHPYSWNVGFTPECVQPDTIAIHHWASSWKPVQEQPCATWR